MRSHTSDKQQKALDTLEVILLLLTLNMGVYVQHQTSSFFIQRAHKKSSENRTIKRKRHLYYKINVYSTTFKLDILRADTYTTAQLYNQHRQKIKFKENIRRKAAHKQLAKRAKTIAIKNY